MTEFSKSLHLYSTRENDAIQLLIDAKCRGYIYPGASAYQTIFVSDECQAKVLRANKGLLLSYGLAEGYSCWVKLYEGIDLISTIECNFDNDKSFIQEEEFVKKGLLTLKQGNLIAKWITSAKFREKKGAHFVGETFGIQKFIAMSFETAESETNGRIDIDPDLKSKTKRVFRHLSSSKPKNEEENEGYKLETNETNSSNTTKIDPEIMWWRRQFFSVIKSIAASQTAKRRKPGSKSWFFINAYYLEDLGFSSGIDQLCKDGYLSNEERDDVKLFHNVFSNFVPQDFDRDYHVPLELITDDRWPKIRDEAKKLEDRLNLSFSVR